MEERSSGHDDDDQCPELVSARVPVTILTGFLGSGKTTLLQYVLEAEHNLRIAVVVNEYEFGRSIEKGLTVQSSAKEDLDWIELNNGCMCCSAKGQVALALESMIRRSGSFDLVLIETAGLANPAPICALFWMDDALSSVLCLSGVVAVVDAKNIAKYLQHERYVEASQQLLVSDRILLNKIDLVSEAGVQDAISAVRAVNGSAPITLTSFSRAPDLRELLFLNTTNELECFVSPAASPHIHSSMHTLTMEVGCASGDAIFAVPSTAAIDKMCASLLYHDGAEPFEIVRLKAAVWVGQPPAELQLHQIQSIGDTFSVTQMAAESVPKYVSRFLLLGRAFSEGEEIRTLVRSTFAQYAAAR